MKGVVLAPLLAAFLAVAVTGSETVGAVAFLAVLFVAGLAIMGSLRRR